MLITKIVKIHTAFLTIKSEVMKKDPINDRIKIKSHNIISKPKMSANFFSLSLSRENSLVETSDNPRSHKIARIETKEKAKVNLPYCVAPKILAT